MTLTPRKNIIIPIIFLSNSGSDKNIEKRRAKCFDKKATIIRRGPWLEFIPRLGVEMG